MKLHRIAALALALMLCMSSFACAEITVANTWMLERAYVSMNARTGVLAVQSRDTQTYTLTAPDGTALTTKPYIYMNNDNELLKVAVDSGLNVFGYLDSTGRELVPTQYGDLIFVTDRWQVGVKLEDATADNYDYKSFNGKEYYLVSAYDVYLDGQKVGTLDRMAYDYAYGYGSYLYVRDENGGYAYYDKNMTPSTYSSKYPSTSEYDETRDGVFHRGSGQQVGVPGCTLTSADVANDVFIMKDKAVDLQGNVLFTVDERYDSVRDFKGDYAEVVVNGKRGLIDRTGREVLACVYDAINCDEEYFEGGYQLAIKDGKVGFLNEAGEVTAEFKYSENNVKSVYRSPFVELADLDGSIIVISGAVGELEQRFVDVQISSINGCPLFIAEVEEDKVGVYDLYGNEVLPADGTYDDTYDLTLSVDGKVILGNTKDRTCMIYQVDLGDGVAQQKAPATVEQPAPADDGSWTCSCGSVNQSKFCTECGTPRPVEVKCTQCGYTPEAGQTPKFCPECGNKF